MVSNESSESIKRGIENSLPYLLQAFCFFIPLKLSLAYCCFYPFLLGSLLIKRVEIVQLIRKYWPICGTFFLFFICVVVSGVAGINPVRSLGASIPLFLIALFIPASAVQFVSALPPLRLPARAAMLLILGQTVAGIHSVLNSTFQDGLPKIFIGQVTESGQLSLVLPFTLGIILFIHRKYIPASFTYIGSSIAFVIATIVCGFASLESSLYCGVLYGALFIGSLCFVYFKNRSRGRALQVMSTLFLIAIPTLIGALFVNLKRGPWMGVACGVTIILLFSARRFILPLVIVMSLAVATLHPVQQRLIGSARDFFMNGGRSDIWEIGSELIQRYPLGIGYKNSAFLQKFDNHIPPELKHFHNNFLNILVETGWLGCIAYLSFIFVVLALAWKQCSGQYGALSLGIFGALCSWQIAGIVEYSFGDSEVLLIGYLLIGGVLALQEIREKYASTDQTVVAP